jgi:hypothetical protein
MDSVVLRVLSQIVELLSEVGQGLFCCISVCDMAHGSRFPAIPGIYGHDQLDWEYRFFHPTTVYSD